MSTVSLDYLFSALTNFCPLWTYGAGLGLLFANCIRSVKLSGKPNTQRRRYQAIIFAVISTIIALVTPFVLGYNLGQIIDVLNLVFNGDMIFGTLIWAGFVGSPVLLVLSPFVAYSVYRHPANYAYAVDTNSYLLTAEIRAFRADPAFAPVPSRFHSL